jgi:hypothetical protein
MATGRGEAMAVKHKQVRIFIDGEELQDVAQFSLDSDNQVFEAEVYTGLHSITAFPDEPPIIEPMTHSFTLVKVGSEFRGDDLYITTWESRLFPRGPSR